jgi:glycosyltransferase involved in cell wall biosynthesis
MSKQILRDAVSAGLVVMIVSGNPFSVGGIHRYVRQLIKTIVATRKDVLLIYRKGFMPKTLLISLDRTLPTSAKEKTVLSEPKFRPIWFLVQLTKLFTFVIFGIPVSLWKLNNLNPSIVHCHDTGLAGLLGTVISKLFNIPLVVHLHGTIAVAEQNYSKYEQVFGRVVIANADVTIPVSSYLIDYYESIGTPVQNFRVIPMGIEVSDFLSIAESSFNRNLSDLQTPPLVVGYLGRLTSEKNVASLLKALSSLKKMGSKQLKLIIVGGGPEEQCLRELSKKLELVDVVSFLGVVERQCLEEFFRAIHVFVLPSFKEGCPITLLEAMAAGKCVMASDIPGIRDVIENGVNGLLINPHNPEDIAAKIHMLSKNKPLIVSLGRNAQTTVSTRFNLKNELQAVLQVYEELLIT